MLWDQILPSVFTLGWNKIPPNTSAEMAWFHPAFYCGTTVQSTIQIPDFQFFPVYTKCKLLSWTINDQDALSVCGWRTQAQQIQTIHAHK